MRVHVIVNLWQSRYHVPRSWLSPTGNLLVIFEEFGGDPAGISLVERKVESVCADIYEGQPSLINLHTAAKPKAHLWCPPGQEISRIKFASFGTPQGKCGNYWEGSCHAHKSYDPLQRVIDCNQKVGESMKKRWLWSLSFTFYGSWCEFLAELHWETVVFGVGCSRGLWRRSLPGYR